MSQNTQHLAEGTTLGGGRYRIVRFIGAGGFGCTYEAEFVPMSTRVAIKEFFVSSCCNREASGAVSVGIVSQTALVGKLEEKFRREAKRLFKMQHPNIVRVSDIIEENGTSYYVMDYISGRSLQDVIDSEGPLPEARALRYIGQVMDALEYVHGEKMLHLDIKPANIMIDGKDRAILIDFGVSKQYDEVDGHNTSTIMGQTPGYAPPEQGDNSIQNFTPAADIYALGATLYTALTGIVPPSAAKLTSGSAHLAPPPAGTSASTKNAIGQMMQPNLKRRPQSVAAVRALLAAAAPPPAIETEPASGTPTAPIVLPSGAETAPVTPAPSGVETAPAASAGAETAPVNPAGAETAPVNPVPVGTRHVASTSAGTQRINAPAAKSKKWLWAAVAAAAIAIGAAAYFLASSGKSTPEESTDPIAQADTIAVAEPVEPSEPTPNGGLSEVAEEPEPVSAQSEPTPEPTPTPTAPTSGYENGHQWLDMGTGVRWATCNVGASSPKDNGQYFAWGETSPKAEYTIETCKTWDDANIGSIAGRSGYDAARANWDGKWRMPTKEDFQELIDKCDWEWDGSGMKVTAKNGNVLYLPAAGWQYGSSLYYVGSYGYYWSATPLGSYNAWYLFFLSGGQNVGSNGRNLGHSVRPVLE